MDKRVTRARTSSDDVLRHEVETTARAATRTDDDPPQDPITPVHANKACATLHEQKQEHPYTRRLEYQYENIKSGLRKFIDLAQTELFILDNSGCIADLTPNLGFADMIEDLYNDLKIVRKDLLKAARDTRDRCASFRDSKLEVQKAIKQKIKEERREQGLSSEDEDDVDGKKNFTTKPNNGPRPKRRILHDGHVFAVSSDEDEPPMPSGNKDTKFLSPKRNRNDPDHHHKVCSYCKKVFRDKTELRNHVSNHLQELYVCGICKAILRSIRSFEAHYTSHTKGGHKCDECGEAFALKTTLRNHMQKHKAEEDWFTCPTCGEKKQYRQGFAEHVKYAHLPTKTVPCPMCRKLFQMPTYMRSHKVRMHGKNSKLPSANGSPADDETDE